MGINLRTALHLPPELHAHEVTARGTYQCDQDFQVILPDTTYINYSEESKTQFGRSFDSKKFCSITCFKTYLEQNKKVKFS